MPFVTFTAETPDGDDLGSVAVTVLSSTGEKLVDSVFATYLPGELARTVELDAGEYVLWARTPEWRFSWPIALTVASGDGPSAAEPRVVALVAAAKTLPVASIPVLVYGYVQMAPPGTDHGTAAGGYGVIRTNRAGGPSTYRYSVQLTHLGVSAAGEVATFKEKGDVVLAPDANGYWEALLPVSTLFRIVQPGVVGSRVFMTPADTARVSVDSLIEEDQSRPYYDLVT